MVVLDVLEQENIFDPFCATEKREFPLHLSSKSRAEFFFPPSPREQQGDLMSFCNSAIIGFSLLLLSLLPPPAGF